MFRRKLVGAVAIAGLSNFATATQDDCGPDYEATADGCKASCIGKDPEPLPDWPDTPFDLNGKAHPQICVDSEVGRFFGIGDWGGSVPGGGTWTNPGRCQGIADMMKLQEASNYTRDYNEFLNAFNSEAETNRNQQRRCDWQDHWAQKAISEQMLAVAEKNKDASGQGIQFVLNAGDNFYPGGVNTQCGQFGSHIPWDPSGQFVGMWHNVYLKGAMSKAPWISALGNHDYGGRGHHTGWDVQVFFTWKHDQWTMPAQYFSQVIQYRDFSIKVFVMDTNYMDAYGDVNHKICQGGGECYDFNDWNCADKLNKAWWGSVAMLEEGLKDSTSDWHFIVTHFPGPSITGQPKIQELNRDHGIDMVFTGHAHYQGMGVENDMFYIISGGGGGATTDAANCEWCPGYGFVSFEITKAEMNLQLINWKGNVNGEKKLTPKDKKHRLRRSESEQVV